MFSRGIDVRADSIANNTVFFLEASNRATNLDNHTNIPSKDAWVFQWPSSTVLQHTVDQIDGHSSALDDDFILARGVVSRLLDLKKSCAFRD